jgi:hypothetical protein
MRTVALPLLAMLTISGCGSSAAPPAPADSGPEAGAGGDGAGAAGTGGTGGQIPPMAGSGGTGETPDAAASPVDTTVVADLVLPAEGGGAGGSAGGKVLYVAGDKPLVGNDGLIHDALKARGLAVQDVTATTVTPAMTEGVGLMIVSYSIQSGTFKGADFADTKVPIIVLEHNVLAQLGMTDGAGHGFVGGGTLTITGDDAALTAGLKGDVNVYGPAGKEMFWGVPGPGAIKVASVKGNPGHLVYFVYPAGAMMVGKPAPAKRMQLFIASHAPPPVTDQFLNADGLKLLGAALDWMLK